MKRSLFFSLLLAIAVMAGQAQNVEINLQKAATMGCVRVTSLKNKEDFRVDVIFRRDGKEFGSPVTLGPHQKRSDIDVTCTSIKVQSVDNTQSGFSKLLWKESDTEKLWRESSKEKTPTTTESPKTESQATESRSKSQSDNKPSTPTIEIATPELPKAAHNLSQSEIVERFKDYVNQMSFLSEMGLSTSASQVDNYVKALENWTSVEACIAENHLDDYVRNCRDSLDTYKTEAQAIVFAFSKQFDADEATNAEILKIINERIAQRESDLARLETAMASGQTDGAEGGLGWKLLINCVVIVLVVMLLILWGVKVNKKKGQRRRQKQQAATQQSGGAPGIVVRRTTTSILKKQSLEDVVDNPAYLKIDCADFCTDSAVRRVYLKNTCVKDIYNMYAEDLRNPNNPKEDGCMVLGRWVQDEDTREYYVSLEQIVRPGDDAVFEEYELNFGGKIKLRVAESLRKLRRETNLQYDMTCWVHSHPGLGVFFSNSDNNVQIQLKHPTHPLFLTAIVVDILTPEQEMGIFTFKKDGTVNAKADLTKMYSLEKLYKWAVESDRSTFKADDYYNALGRAAKHYDDCAEVQLSNGAIIDMGMLTTELEASCTAYVHGFRSREGSKTRCVCNAVSRHEAVPDNEMIGCFVTASHCSFPSIRKVVENRLKDIDFVLVASSSDGLLTAIPVADGELCGDTNYYGEENLEELKIWTRRKR